MQRKQQKSGNNLALGGQLCIVRNFYVYIGVSYSIAELFRIVKEILDKFGLHFLQATAPFTKALSAMIETKQNSLSAESGQIRSTKTAQNVRCKERKKSAKQKRNGRNAGKINEIRLRYRGVSRVHRLLHSNCDLAYDS